MTAPFRVQQGDEPAFEVRVGECVELEADEVEVDGTPAPYVVLVAEMYQDVKVGGGEGGTGLLHADACLLG